MDDQIVAELTALRARAYGPGGGLGQDPDALRRLGDLEELARPKAAVDAGGRAVGVDTPAGEAPSAAAEPEAIAAVEPGVEETPAPSEKPQAGLWWTRRRIAVFWVASLVVAVLVASTISAAFTYRLQADPREVAVLRADPGAKSPEFFGDQDGRVFVEFYGLRAMSQEGFVTGPGSGPNACLQVADKSILDADLQQGFSGFFSQGGCGAGAFAPTAALVVAEDAPEELRARFPDGTSLQFVLRGSEVVVLEVPPLPTAEPSIDAAR